MFIETNIIYNEECLQGMSERISDNSIDMILADLPYGTTQNNWDSVIPLEPLWNEYKRLINENGAIVLTAGGKFTPKLKVSNLKWFRYEWIWNKKLTSDFLNANRKPLRAHENVLVFYKKQPTYNPQKYKGEPNHSKGDINNNEYRNENYGDFDLVDNKEKLGDMKYPKTIIDFQKPHQSVAVHPTEKPVSLFEYLIKTYTKENEVVLDNVMGSGTTAVACLKTNRKFIGFEKEEKYYNISLKRIGKFDKSYYNELPESERPAQKQLF